MKRMHHFIKSLALIGLFIAASSAQALVLGPFVPNPPGTVALLDADVNGTTETYTIGKLFNSLDPITISTVAGVPAAATTVVFDEIIINNSGVAWTDYHIDLGFTPITSTDTATVGPLTNLSGGAFNNFGQAGFVGAATSGAFTLGAPVSAIAFPFSTVSIVGNTLNFAGGVVNPLEMFSLSFSFVVPVSDNGFNLTITQTPTVPEPASLALLGLGLAGLGFSRRKKTV